MSDLAKEIEALTNNQKKLTSEVESLENIICNKLSVANKKHIQLEAKVGGIGDACVAMLKALDRTLDQLIKDSKDEAAKTTALQMRDGLGSQLQDSLREQFESMFDVVVKMEPGDVVLCDLCNKDWTDSDVSGGLLFSSKGVCPDCAPKFEEDAKKEGEEDYIQGRCPENMSHADWIRDVVRPGEVGEYKTVKEWREDKKDG